METRKETHLAPEDQDREKEETKRRMRNLWILLILLILILIAAIVYEIILGNGNVQTGSERMEEPVLMTEKDSEAVSLSTEETDPETESGSDQNDSQLDEQEEPYEGAAEPEEYKETETDDLSGRILPSLAGVGG